MKLEDYKGRQPFTVPDNYFEQFNSNMINMLHNEPAKKENKKRIIALPTVARYIGYAAAVVITLAIGTTLLTKNEQNNEYISSEEYIEGEYIDEILNNYPIDDYTFYCYLTGSEIN